MQKTSNRKPSTRSAGRKVFLITILGLLVLLVTEFGARIIFSVVAGPRVMLYGTPWHRLESTRPLARTDMLHNNQMAGYTKYFPNEKKRDRNPVTREVFDVSINGQGFRGADFELEKAPGTVRVVTLGASSTFGYHNRDDETYPYYLEQNLNSRNKALRFEVINLAIPNLTTEQILALFIAEALPLEPDVVTFYEGVNDAADMELQEIDQKNMHALEQTLREKIASISILRTVYRGARERILLLALVDSLIKSEVLWTVSQEYYAKHIAGKKERFLSNVSAINDLCSAQGILFIVIKQQARSTLIDEMAGLTYEDEVEIVLRMLDEGEPIGYFGLSFLTHKLLTDALETWANRNDVPLVDVIELLNERRELVWTWVHLHPEANLMIAEELAETISSRILEAGRP